MKKFIFTGLVILFMAVPTFGAITAYKHYNDGLGVWDQTLTTSYLWSDWLGENGAIDHLASGRGNFPAGNSAFRGCVELTPPVVIYHHDYDGVVWNNDEGTISLWVAPHWNGENQGGASVPAGSYNDIIIGDGNGEFVGSQGFNVFFFSNGPDPGYQLFVLYTDNGGVNQYNHYLVGNTMDWVAGEWHHICVSWDATEVMVGIDGTIFMKETRDGGFNMANGGYLLGIGAPRNSWDGWADDITISNTADYTGYGDVNGSYPVPTEPSVAINDKKAWLPTPVTGTTVDKVTGSTLAWNAGTDAVTHKVYWSDDLAEVAGRTVTPIDLSIGTETTATPATPAIGETYYWAVDEVDSVPATHAGDLWQYTIVPYIIVDDMEDYDGSTGSSTDVWSVWVDGYYGTSGSAVHAIDDGYEGTKQAMEYEYSNNGTSPYGPSGYPYYSEVVADTSNLDCGSDWTAEGVAWLQLNFKGLATNDANERMYVVIEDGNTPTPNEAMVQYGLPDSYSNPEWAEDMNDIKLDTWTSWGIDLRSFTGVNLADVQKVYIGFGTRGNTTTPGGAGTVVFDELRLQVPGVHRPIVPLDADLSGDNTVNFIDLAYVANDWLGIGDDGMWPQL